MKEYTYDDIVIGQEESFQTQITPESLDMFKNLTGDCNPLHCDEEYAKNKGYSGRVSYGMLTASLLSTLAGMYLPGKNSLIHETEVKFTKPLIVPDNGTQLNVVGSVTEKHDLFKRITVKVAITDASGDKVLRGTMKIGISV